jgi:hypothetical protein
MMAERPRRPGTTGAVNQDAEAYIVDRTTIDKGSATTSAGPTWYLDARPLTSCHDDHADEYAIDCPMGDHEALAWRSRPGGRGSGWACPLGHRGQLFQLLPVAS